jgi:hypothetical protein
MAFESRLLKKIFRFEADQVMEKFVISEQIVIILLKTTSPFLIEIVVVFDGTTTFCFKCTNTAECPL